MKDQRRETRLNRNNIFGIIVGNREDADEASRRRFERKPYDCNYDIQKVRAHGEEVLR